MNIKSLARLNLKQWCWLFEAFVRLTWVRVRLRIAGARWIHKQLTLSSFQEIPIHTNIDNDSLAQEMHESVRLAARIHSGQVACLPRSIVLSNMLVARKQAAELKIGVSSAAPGFGSHAWVEVAGQMVSEPESVAAEFVPLDL